MNVLIYILVLLSSLVVDIVPFIGPPAWIVMVFFQVRFGLNIWIVLLLGVAGSAAGRYLYSAYIYLLAKRFIKPQKNGDLQFIGGKLANKSWKVQLFVFLYTLIPLPSTPLFTAAGCSRIKTIYLIPAFFLGKFISDAVMVFSFKVSQISPAFFI
jgi:membrane protein YqaA with SNARE-associated domain